MCLSDADMLVLFLSLSLSLVFTGLDGEAVDELSSQFSFYAQIGREGEHEGEDKCEVSGMGGLQVREKLTIERWEGT